MIYLITNDLNGKVYIGKTIQTINVRWRKHLSEACRGSSFYIHRALRKYGIEHFHIQPFASALVLENLCELEKDCIKFLDSTNPEKGYNQTIGGEGTAGIHLSPETKAKLSRASMGNQNFLGRKHTPEARAKMRRKKQGHVVSLKARANMSAVKMGNQYARKQKTPCKLLPIS